MKPRTTAGNLKQAEKRQLDREFSLERYKYILQQIHTVNENVYKFLAIYQTLASSLVAAGLALFIGYRTWGITPVVTRSGIVGLMLLVTVIGSFTALLIVIGVFTWLDYRKEECELTDRIVYAGFRKPPKVGNFIRWYETYIILFIIGSIAFMWGYALTVILPQIR
ncbi:hypothetical protein SMD20_18685 [Nonomuraea sp. LP-02]|uniref:hypothetical protein n=1 Tax=Nonomuraea sp. LP-02 TaxID=3097960 RepID=UPI002E34D5BB|nr:hypothetical protein [Nonomuraea sp. LP-02]MED7926289.1 hypothetical protein [Nonomuraea sp. LP-02]